MRSIWIVLFLFTCWSSHCRADIKLVETNRMLPLASLYEPTKSNYQLANKLKPPLEQNILFQLTITNTQNKTTQWVLTQSHQSDMDTVMGYFSHAPESLVELTVINHDWPLAVHTIPFTLGPLESLTLLVTNPKTAPQQLWSSSWWTTCYQEINDYIYLLWGAALCLVAVQLLIAIPTHGVGLVSQLACLLLLWLTSNHFSLLLDTRFEPLLLPGYLSMLLIVALLRFKRHQLKYRETGWIYLLIVISAGAALSSQVDQLDPLHQIHTGTLILGIITLIWLSHQYQSTQEIHVEKWLKKAGYLIAIAVVVSLQYRQMLTHLLWQDISIVLLQLSILSVSLAQICRQLSSSLCRISELSKQNTVTSTKEYQQLKEQFDVMQFNYQLLQQKNVIDFLTGLKNRQFFDEKYHYELTRSSREKSPLSLIIIDLDFFKRVNDQYGHPVGDEVLKAVAKRLYYVLKRPTDAVCRYGGEEFVVLLPNTHLQGAKHIAEKLRQSVKSKPIRTAKGDISITISQGVASITSPSVQDESTLLKNADLALYRAKANGRDRIELAACNTNQAKSTLLSVG